jgi:hypothetical protein
MFYFGSAERASDESSGRCGLSTVAASVPPLAVAHRPMEEHGEPALLTVIEALIERLRGLGQFLQVGCAGAQTLGRAGEAIDRIDLDVFVLILVAAVSPGG